MSRNEWESGTVKLPTGEFPKVRKAMEDADRKAKTAHFERAQAFWKGLPAKAKRDIARLLTKLRAREIATAEALAGGAS